MQAIGPWKKISEKYVYKNPWMRIREDKVINPVGAEGIYAVVESDPGVYVAAFNDEDKILLLKNFRYPTNNAGWELPGGGGAEESSLEEKAREELEEEAGFQAEELSLIGKFEAFNGLAVEYGHVFIARGLKDVGEGIDKETEGIVEEGWFSWKEIIEMIKSGDIICAQSISGLLHVGIHLDKIVTPE